MKAPRYAHWLLVPTLALGMAMGPVRAHAAPVKPTGGAEPAPKGKAGEAPKGKAGEAPKGKAGEAPKGKAGEAPKSEAEPPDDEAEATPEAEAEAEPESEAEPAPTPEAGTPPAAEAEPTEPPPTEPPPTEPPLEPEVTVQPSAVEPSVRTSAPAPGAASREAVADPRRVRSDERVLFRAGLLSLGVAAAALVPTVYGFQQASVARREDLDAQERTLTRVGIGAGIAAGTYAITGVVLLALGARQRRAMVAPAVGPGQLGAVLRARF